MYKILYKQENRHVCSIPYPSTKSNFVHGDIIECDECGQVYILKHNLDEYGDLYRWKALRWYDFKAKKTLKKLKS